MDFRTADEVVYKTMQLFGCFVEFNCRQVYGYLEDNEAAQVRIGDVGTLMIIPTDPVCILFIGDVHSSHEWLQWMQRWSVIESWDAVFNTALTNRYIQAEEGALQQVMPEPLPEAEELVAVM